MIKTMKPSRIVTITCWIGFSVLSAGVAESQPQRSAGAALDALSFAPPVFPSCQQINGTAGGCYQGLRFGQNVGGVENLGGGDILRLLFGVQSQTFPVGSPASGFTFTFDSGLGLPTRSTNSFGPIFGERALTNGRNNVSFSFNVINLSWYSFNGNPMREGTYQSQSASQK